MVQRSVCIILVQLLFILFWGCAHFSHEGCGKVYFCKHFFLFENISVALEVLISVLWSNKLIFFLIAVYLKVDGGHCGWWVSGVLKHFLGRQCVFLKPFGKITKECL